ncbi:MAG: hypothetical protein DRI44_07095 [Chlamydiae bacterium]|nr:MAG: hypothetical protein DRI44_07095 [Chlamydiota bacterium]
MKIFTLTFILIFVMLLSVKTSFAAGENSFGYIVKLYWLGDPVVNDMDLILRNPKDADSVNRIAPLDCFYGQQNPDWGISGYELDNPIWATVSYGETNVEQVIARELLDIGTFTIIARAHTGSAKCWVEIEKWRFEDIEYLDEKLLTANTTSDEAIYLQQSNYQDMNIRPLKFKQKKSSGKYILKVTQNNLPSELPTNELVRVYLNDEAVFTDNGSHWIQNATGKKYTIGKPWTMKVLLNSKSSIYVRGFANNIYKSANVNCNVLIGNYLGTNFFRTTKKCRYKYKEHKELHPK